MNFFSFKRIVWIFVRNVSLTKSEFSLEALVIARTSRFNEKPTNGCPLKFVLIKHWVWSIFHTLLLNYTVFMGCKWLIIDRAWIESSFVGIEIYRKTFFFIHGLEQCGQPSFIINHENENEIKCFLARFYCKQTK